MVRSPGRVIAVADLPPPIQGISIVSQWVIETLRDNTCLVEILNTSVSPRAFYAFRRAFRFIRALLIVLRSKSNDTIYVALSHGSTLFAQTAIILLSKKLNRRILVHHHTYLPITKPRLLMNKFCHSNFKKKVEHIFLTNTMRDAYCGVWKPIGRTWIVTNHGIAKRRVGSFDSLIVRNKTKIGFTGRMTEEKGFWHAEMVVRNILNANKNFCSIFLGPSNDKSIINAINNLANQFPNRFRYISEYDETILRRELSDTTYFLFPSLYKNEASPLVVLEAQALGNICFTTNLGSLSENVIAPGEAIDLTQWPNRVQDAILQLNQSDLKFKNPSLNILNESTNLANQSEDQLLEVFM